MQVKVWMFEKKFNLKKLIIQLWFYSIYRLGFQIVIIIIFLKIKIL